MGSNLRRSKETRVVERLLLEKSLLHKSLLLLLLLLLQPVILHFPLRSFFSKAISRENGFGWRLGFKGSQTMAPQSTAQASE